MRQNAPHNWIILARNHKLRAPARATLYIRNFISESRILDIMHIASGDLWASAEVQLFTLVLALQRTQQVNVVVILLNHGKLEQQLQVNGICVIVLDESRLNGLQILRKLIKCMREIHPDIVHTHRFKKNILGSIAAFNSGMIAGIRTVDGAQEQDVNEVITTNNWQIEIVSGTLAFFYYPPKWILFEFPF
jgi:hypothetical protein